MQCGLNHMHSLSVHPHGRGDNHGDHAMHGVQTGSPPRAWGQFWNFARFSFIARFTPTGVGTMLQRASAPADATVHPHGRGDNRKDRLLLAAPRGSPPRAWGQWGLTFDPDPDDRFTPTGVGTIDLRCTTDHNASVHPHGRGDNRIIQWDEGIVIGSPPRAWGQFINERVDVLDTRFTPTGVGTMMLYPQRAVIVAVHPHGRGDNEYEDDPEKRRFGSPPRAWGQCAARGRSAAKTRFTPTGVGTIT